MTDKARKNWMREYIDLLSQAAGTAYILGYKDAAAVLHRLSVDAMGLCTKRARKVIDNTAKNEEEKTMKTYTRYEYEGYDIYVDDDTKKVHHAVKIDAPNPTTLYPYEPCKTGGLDNCCEFYTLQQVKSRMKTGKICFK